MATTAQVYYEDIEPGFELPRLKRGPLTPMHLMRWSAAMENWHRIHYDERFATEHDRLPGLLISGSQKQQFIVQLLKDWAGSGGWVWKISFQFRAMNVAGETLEAWGRVTAKREGPGYGLIDLEVGLINDKGVESTPGKAVVALPHRGGPAVPYPFVEPQAG